MVSLTNSPLFHTLFVTFRHELSAIVVTYMRISMPGSVAEMPSMQTPITIAVTVIFTPRNRMPVSIGIRMTSVF